MSGNAIMALMTKLELLFSGAEGTFLTFQNPGLPVSPRDLSFNLPQSESGLTPQEAHNASANFARLVNLVPAYSSVWSSDGRLLWDEYRSVLTQALVASQSLTEAQAAELRAAEELVMSDSPKLAAYMQYEKAYLDALEQYNARKLSAENSTDPKIQQDWQVKEPTYKSEVNRAYSDWVAKGYKAEIDEAFADIDRLTGRSPQLAWATWKQAFPSDPPLDLQGQEFYETSFWPANFFKPDSQTHWTKLELDASEIGALSLKASNSIRQMGSRSGSATDDAQALGLEISRLSVELARVEVIRPWFKPNVFRSRFWKWPDEREPLSDGQEPPQGSLLGYVVSMIFARNLEIKLKPNSESNKQIVKQLQTAKPVYVGPLRLEQVNSRIDPKSVSTLKSAHLASVSLKEIEPFLVRRVVASDLTAKVQSVSRVPEAALRSVRMDTIGSTSKVMASEVITRIRPIETEEKITFDTLPDGTPTAPDRLLTGDEFLAKGIRLAGSPESTYCAGATATAIRRAGTYSSVTFPFLTTASPGDINRCNSIPIAITFTRPVRQVTLTFAGASVTYTMKAYNTEGKLLGTVQKEAVLNGGTFDITFNSATPNISRVTFGYQAAVTAIKEIRYKASPTESEQEPKTEGLQLIAFLCQKLPKSPNPETTLNYS
ncbi:MAG: hypothetical protein AB1589_36005 [Cyanobacteriota bacterium]